MVGEKERKIIYVHIYTYKYIYLFEIMIKLHLKQKVLYSICLKLP